MLPSKLRRAGLADTKRQGKFTLQARLIKWVVFMCAGLLCGVLLVRLGIVTRYTPERSQSPSTVTTQHKSVAAAESNLPTQDDPLFAARPAWSQNFQNQTPGTLDLPSWNVLVGQADNSNHEQQYYTADPSNIRIENGALRLIATHQPEPNGYAYGSARIETEGKQTFLYGRIDIDAKLPSGVGTWPAVWLLPANDVYAQKSPESDPLRYRNGGEIDILEAVGFIPDTVYGVAHTLSDLSLRSDGTGAHGTVRVPGSSASFNKYTLLWTPTSLVFEVNGNPYATYSRQQGADYTTWPFDQPFYLIANLAMGGSWGGLDTAHYPGNGIDNNALPTSLDIRSIYYYPYVGPKG